MLEIIIFRKYHFKNAKELDAFQSLLNIKDNVVHYSLRTSYGLLIIQSN